MDRTKLVKGVGVAVAAVGCFTADMAAKAILKEHCPEATNGIKRLAIKVGIGFIGYAVGSMVYDCIIKEAEEFNNTLDECEQEVNRAVDEIKNSRVQTESDNVIDINDWASVNEEEHVHEQNQ